MAWQKLGIQGWAALKEFEPQARAAARKALELDDRLAEAHVAQGHLQFFYDWDWKGGENSIRRALELDPNNLDAHYNYSVLLMALGRFPEAIAEIQTAEQLDPLSHQVQVQLRTNSAPTLGNLMRHSGAFEAGDRTRTPQRPGIRRLAAVYEQMGRYTEALEIHR